MNIERTVKLREGALALVPQVLHPVLGIPACLGGRYETLFTRDMVDSATQVLREEANVKIPELVEAVKRSVDISNKYKGVKDNPETDEEPDRRFHEIYLPVASQSQQMRLKQLERGGMPVRRDDETGYPYMVNYFAGDANGKMSQVILAVAESIEYLDGRAQSDDYLAGMWPEVKSLTAYNLRNTQKYEMGVVITDPKNRCGFEAQTWGDGKRRYSTDEGRELEKGPKIFFSNVANAIRGYDAASVIAERLGNMKDAVGLALESERGRERLDKLCWSDKLQTYVPVIDKNGPMEIINDDPIDGLYCRVVPEDRVEKVIGRLLEPDMLTKYGIRTRSKRSTRYTEKGFLAYQNGALWPNRNTMAVLGCVNYGMLAEASLLAEAVGNYVEEAGFRELMICTKRGEELKPYCERGKEVAPLVQSWALFGYLGVSAWEIRRYEEQIALNFQVNREPQRALVA